MKKSFFASGVVVLLFLATVQAGAQEPSKLILKLEQTTPVPSVTRGFDLALKCDREGNVYIRSARGFSEPLLKISLNGEKLAEFSVASATGWENGEFYEFAVRPDGGVDLLAARRGKGRTIEPGIVQFSEQGRFRYATQLDVAPYAINQLVVFGTEEFLTSGWKRERPAGESEAQASNNQAQKEDLVEPLLAVVNPVGETVQRLRIGGRDQEAPGEQALTVSWRAISLATAAPGDDGFNFLMQREENAKVLVVSPQSGVVGALDVSSPKDKFSPTDLRYSSGIGLIVQFDERLDERRFDPQNGVISLVHPQTGERLADYQLAPEVGGILGCHPPRGFLFVQVNNQRQGVFHRATSR